MAARVLQELFVCFALSKCLEGGLHSRCQSQAIRANGSTRLYVGRVWGLLFSWIGLFLFPGSWKTPGLENTLYSASGDWAACSPTPHPRPTRGWNAFPEYSLNSIFSVERLEWDEAPCVGLGRPLPTWTCIMVQRRVPRPSFPAQTDIQVPTGSSGTLRAVSGPGDCQRHCWVCGGEDGRLSVLGSVTASQKGRTFHCEPSNSQTYRPRPSLFTSLGDSDKMSYSSFLGIFFFF